MPIRETPRSLSPASKSLRAISTHTRPALKTSASIPGSNSGGSRAAQAISRVPRMTVSTCCACCVGNAMRAYSASPRTPTTRISTVSGHGEGARISSSRVGIATAAVASLARSTQALPGHHVGHATKSALPLLIMGERLEELALTEIGPQRVGDVDLAIRALPQKEVGDPHLAAGADEQIGVWNIGRGQIAPEQRFVDAFRVELSLLYVACQLAGGVYDFIASA